MPRICLDMNAVTHNLHIVKRLAAEWNFTWLPVLKMVAGYPPVADVLRANGYAVTGAADIDEHLCFGTPPAPDSHVYINLVPPHLAGNVARRFRRSAVSSPEGLRALDRAAGDAGIRHDVLLMVDLGDGREGAPVGPALDALLEQTARKRLAHVRVVGMGVTLGCLNGLCPDETIMRRLVNVLRAARRGPGLFADDPATISLGGSIFWNWFALHHAWLHDQLRETAGWRVELRMGDPLLLGFDMYRNEAFLGGTFRRDLFEIQANVLEVRTKRPHPGGIHAANGHGGHSPQGNGKARVQALADCGILHTDVADLALDLPGATVMDFSGNYAVLDVTACAPRPRPGDVVRFRPGYWAVARAFRTPQTKKITVPRHGAPQHGTSRPKPTRSG